jgi:tRNA(Ile)-lysidine synthase
MPTLLERVRATVSSHGLFGAGDGVIVAVSGGADSTALAHALALLAPDLGIRLLGLAHLNHQLRDAADADEAFCAALAVRLGVPFDTRRLDVGGEARRRKTSVEDAARTVRYAYLNEVAAAAGANRVAVGHTRDDQAETVLLRLARGAGPVGLAGIHPRAGSVVRPLLDCRRRDIEAWLRARGLGWREDESNLDRGIPRNAVRHDVLPRVVDVFGDGVVDVLARQAALSRDDAEWFEMVATETAARLVIEDGAVVQVERAALGALHAALARRVVLVALRRAAGGRFVGFEHVEIALGLSQAPGSGAVDLPGQRVECRRGWLRFVPRQADPGRAGRRRGRPSSVESDANAPVTGVAVSNPAGGDPARPSGGPEAPRPGEINQLAAQVTGGPKRARSVSLEGHAPKGGRG